MKASPAGADAIVEGRADTVKAAVDEIMETMLGKDPMPIEDHWNTIYRSGFYRGGPILMSALSGIDQALWDIKGKFFNAPVFELMGGKTRDKMKVYTWIAGDRPADIGKAAMEAKKNGFTAVKMNATDEMQIIDSYQKIEKF
jgi:galactonate dehydratase